MMNVPVFETRPREESVSLYESVFRALLPDGALTLDYPLVNAGPSSDFYILPRSVLPGFAHVCGVLSAAGCFTEVAVGTAIALSAPSLRLAAEAGLTLGWRSKALTVREAFQELKSDPTLAVVHPVKLSTQLGELDRWREADIPDPRRSSQSDLVRARLLNAEFEPASYLAANPDVAEAGVEAASHFVNHGWREGRRLRP